MKVDLLVFPLDTVIMDFLEWVFMLVFGHVLKLQASAVLGYIH